jgi:hypothetical protein
MIGLYQGEGFLSSLVLHNDNMTDLIQSVREKYGQEMSNLQVLHVMYRKPPNNFFPNNHFFPVEPSQVTVTYEGSSGYTRDGTKELFHM